MGATRAGHTLHRLLGIAAVQSLQDFGGMWGPEARKRIARCDVMLLVGGGLGAERLPATASGPLCRQNLAFGVVQT